MMSWFETETHNDIFWFRDWILIKGINSFNHHPGCNKTLIHTYSHSVKYINNANTPLIKADLYEKPHLVADREKYKTYGRKNNRNMEQVRRTMRVS